MAKYIMACILDLAKWPTLMYRVSHKFSYTWNELFVMNWFISKIFWGNTKWKNISCPHYLKILMKLSKHGISYTLRHDPRSISKMPIWLLTLLISSIDFYKDLQYLHKIKRLFNKAIQLTSFRPRYCWLEYQTAFFWKITKALYQ